MCEILESTGHSQILVRPEIIEMVQGCPRNPIAAWNYLTQVEQIDPRVLLVPSSCQPLSVLIQLAKTITQNLNIFTQLWLLNYWQYQLWKAHRNTLIAEILSIAKKSLHLAQPQLVFDVCLMKLAEFEAFLRVCA
jgi:DNA polymerase-3 subunit delta'